MNIVKYILASILAAPAAVAVWTIGLWMIKWLFLENADGLLWNLLIDAAWIYLATLLSSLLLSHAWCTPSPFLITVAKAAGHALLAASLYGLLRGPVGGLIVGLLGGVILMPLLIFGAFWQIHWFRSLHARLGLADLPTETSIA